MPIGFNLPFQVSTGSVGYFSMTDDEISTVKNDINSILVTNWGERVMRNNFGCNMIEFLFEQKSDSLKERIADRIFSQLSLWLPFVSIEELNIIYSEDDPSIPENGIGVRVSYFLTSKPDLRGSDTFIVAT